MVIMGNQSVVANGEKETMAGAFRKIILLDAHHLKQREMETNGPEQEVTATTGREMR